MAISPEDYFRYHPPITEDRRNKHDITNRQTYLLWQSLTLIAQAVEPSKVEATITCGEFAKLLTILVDNEVCKRWALRSLDSATVAAMEGDEEAVLMHIQQVRMFINQGITIDDLERRNSAPTTETEI